MTLTSVDLPAPLSPTRATTSPGWTSKSTPSSACTGPNLLLTPLSERIAPFVAIFLSFSSPGSASAPGELMRLARCVPSPHPLSGDARLLAVGLVRAGADLCWRVVAVRDHGRLDVVLRHRHRGEDDRGNVGRAVVGGLRLASVAERLGDLGWVCLLALRQGNGELRGG